MSTNNHVCPECGGRVVEGGVCENCGLICLPSNNYVNDIPDTTIPFNPRKLQIITTPTERKIERLIITIDKVLQETRVGLVRENVVEYLRRLGTLNMLHSGRSGDVIVAAVIFLLSRKRDVEYPTSIDEVARSVRTTPYAVLSTVVTIKNKDHDYMGNVNIATDPFYHLSRFLRKMKLTVTNEQKAEIERTVQAIVKVVYKYDSQCGRRIVPVVAALFVMSCECYDVQYDRKELSRMSGVTWQTIEERIKDFKTQLVGLCKRMSGGEQISEKNVSWYLGYIVDVCIPFLSMCSIAPLLEHPKIIRLRDLRSKREKQIESVRTMEGDLESEQLRTIRRMVRDGMDEGVITGCKSAIELKRKQMEFEVRKANQIAVKNQSKTINDEIKTEEEESDGSEIKIEKKDEMSEDDEMKMKEESEF
ncbi:hypothetical protein EIN_153290 [Entamoeba invadens IP1]|uniref:Transcription initiation factor IIB n=1 Tax=Entamoeba invadens IP1 TaxID=370355 RepID=A0A0A1U8Z5_ENTIV|nr:hypothetical protein EIN_153290 [Entamoeba invadens IP1]ELP91322.1 hypothetical protein EIN_153290 [Entamoeba invadens IP1]|eukprot:XP_004258093.1 hypothetical protein EIN_153290 [Entamoeba invadens IP1]